MNGRFDGWIGAACFIAVVFGAFGLVADRPDRLVVVIVRETPAVESEAGQEQPGGLEDGVRLIDRQETFNPPTTVQPSVINMTL